MSVRMRYSRRPCRAVSEPTPRRARTSGSLPAAKPQVEATIAHLRLRQQILTTK